MIASTPDRRVVVIGARSYGRTVMYTSMALRESWDVVTGYEETKILLDLSNCVTDCIKVSKVEEEYDEFYLEYFVPINLFKKHWVQRFTRYIRKIPGGFDRMVNKRKTYLISLV